MAVLWLANTARITEVNTARCTMYPIYRESQFEWKLNFLEVSGLYIARHMVAIESKYFIVPGMCLRDSCQLN